MRFVCSRIDESVELSNQFNQMINPETGRFFRTIALNGDATEEERQRAFERLAMDEDENMQPLDYIFSVEILNEGVDIVEVNQVIMLRPTESPIVFIQQLGYRSHCRETVLTMQIQSESMLSAEIIRFPALRQCILMRLQRIGFLRR